MYILEAKRERINLTQLIDRIFDYYKKYNPKVMIIEHTEFGKFDRSFADFILQDPDYYIAHATPLNFIIVHKNVKRK